MRTILVTGGAGFIGSHFVRYWLQQHPEDRVVNLDMLTYAGNLPNLDDVAQAYPDRYAFVRGDIGNYELVLHLLTTFRPEFIVNFAAESHNSRAVKRPDLFYKTNLMGTQTLLEAARQAGAPRFHHISTCEVYGELPIGSPDKFTETSPLRPRTPYSSSKAAAELAVRAYYETFHLPITISNCCNNYGPYQFPEKVIPHFTVNALEGRKLPLYQSSHHLREWLHVLDHCRAVERILLDGRVGETYNVGSGLEVSVETMANLILDILGLDRSYKMYVPDRPGHDSRYLLDSSKIEQELGWRPTIPFEQGLRETINWYAENRPWWERLLARLEVAEDKW